MHLIWPSHLSQLDVSTKATVLLPFRKGCAPFATPKGTSWAQFHRPMDHLTNSSRANCTNYANVATGKISISEAHCKLDHISHTTIRNAISSGQITWIELDMDLKPEFYKPCIKVKSARVPFPKKSVTHAMKYGEWVHWDQLLWRVLVETPMLPLPWMTNGDHTCEKKLYFQLKKSDTFKSYKQDEPLMKMQSSNEIKTSCSDRGGEFF